MLQAWFPQFFSFWNNGGNWSISVDAFYYFTLPLVLPTLTRFTFRQIGATALLCWTFAVLPGLTAEQFAGILLEFFYATPIYRFPEFLIGVCLYLATRLNPNYKMPSIFQLVTPIIFVIYLGFFGPKMPIYVGHNWITLPAAALMIFSLSN